MATNEKQRIDVIVSGPMNSAKSTIARLVKGVLELAGIEATNVDDSAQHLDATVHLMPQRIEAVAGKAHVVVNTTNHKFDVSTACRGQGGQAVIPFNGRLYVSSLATDVEPGSRVCVSRIDREGDRINVALSGSFDWQEWDAIDT